MKKINEMFFLRPWAIKEDFLSPISEILERHASGQKLNFDEIFTAETRAGKSSKPSYEVIGGVARIPIYGVIAKRASMVNRISQPEGTSTEEVAKNFKAALKDESVKSIALDIDSPGGSVDGVSELSDLIYNAKRKKEVVAYASGQMCSAAYWIGSAANKIYATKSTEVGSIGVYAVMTDWSVANHNEGVKREVVKAGKYKAAGHPDKPMTQEDRAVVQDGVDQYFKLFTDAVSRNRGMNAQAVEQVATGRTFIGSQALDAGLIDGIAEIDSVLEGSENTFRVEEPTAGNIAGNEQTKTQEEDMDLQKLTLDELKVARPDLLSAFGATEREAGAASAKATAETEASQKAEAGKNRVNGILKSAQAIGGVEEAAIKAINDGELVESAENSMKAAKLDLLQKNSPPPLGGGNSETSQSIEASDLPVEEKAEKLWAMETTRKDFSTREALVGYLKAVARGSVRIFSGNKVQK